MAEPDVFISDLPVAGALTGTEVLPGEQSGATKQITAAAIAALNSASIAAVAANVATNTAAITANGLAITNEASRAATAEALKLAKGSNLADVANAATALANLGGQPLIPNGTYVDTTSAAQLVAGALTLVPQSAVAALKLGAPSIAAADVLQRTSAAEVTIGGATVKEFAFGPVGSDLAGGTRAAYTRIASGKADASWYHMAETFSWESGTYIDRTYNWGYNRANDGSKASAAEPQLFWQMETKFRNNSGTPYGSECHLNFGRPTDSGVYSRPINVFMEHVTGYNSVAFAGDVTITNATATEALYSFPAGGSAVGPPTIFKSKGLLLAGYPAAGPATGELWLQADTRFPGLFFRSAGTNKADIICDAVSGVLYMDHSAGFIMRSGSNGFVVAQIIAAAGQASIASMLEMRASDQATILSRFDGDGYFMTRKSAAPADASLAAGELAIWFDKTNGAAKAMFKGKQADGTVRTAAVAMA